MEQHLRVSIPPLLGDGAGNYRVHVAGNSGTGKSTLAQELAEILGVPYISLDTLFWQPGWGKTPPDEFRAKIAVALTQDPRGWVVDGEYQRRVGSVIQDRLTDKIWLDPPLVLYFPRLCVRTFRRLFGLQASCAPGCSESLREVFCSKNSILWWALSRHWKVRKIGTETMRVDGIHVGGVARRIGGWGGELRAWKQGVRDMVQAQAQVHVQTDE